MSVKYPIRIVCYGDSNTWGQMPTSGSLDQPPFEYPKPQRWTSILQKTLGNAYEVIPEGLPGRTIATDDRVRPNMSGKRKLGSILGTRNPVSLIVIMLGTNDATKTYGLSAEKIAAHLEKTIVYIQKKNLRKFPLTKIPKILVVCPPPVIVPAKGKLAPQMEGAPVIFKKLPKLFEKVALKRGAFFLDAGQVITSSKIDGIHWDAKSHRSFGRQVGKMVEEMKLQKIEL